MVQHTERPTQSDTSWAAYRAAFKNIDADAAIIDATHPYLLIDATDRFRKTWRFGREALGRPLSDVLPAKMAANLIQLARETNRDHDTDSAHSASPNHSARAFALGGGLVCLTLSRETSISDADRYAVLEDYGHISGGMTYVYDVRQRRTRHLSKGLANLLGFKSHLSVDLDSVMALIHPDDIPAVEANLANYPRLSEGQVARLTFRIRSNPLQPWRWLECHAGMFARDTSGEVRAVLGYVFDVTSQRVTADKLATTIDALNVAEDAERQRIARDLHDSTAQHLLAADLLIAAHVRSHAEDIGEQDSLRRSRETLRHALQEIRTFSFLLSPPNAPEQTFTEAVRTFARGFAKRADLALDLDIGAMPTLPSDIEMAIFRVCQEAFMNARRHANAHRIKLHLFIDRDDIVLAIRDDGIGVGEKIANPGVGISSMHARLERLGGRLSVEDTGSGTLVCARAPLRGAVNDRKVAH